ncbi:MAG: ECF transporter S component [Bacteroidales bacterium]|jgi:hypothetical protein|nr:ECF transporter S component [Bacteroidales bacterium]
MKSIALTYPVSVSLRNAKTYLFALLFTAGNVLFPLLFHAIPQGGHIFLPIFFFTLIGAFQYGLWVGVFTALCSPLLSHALMGMPAGIMLPIVMAKSIILVLCARAAVRYFQKISLPVIVLAVAASQVLGFVAEWIIAGNISQAIHDVYMGIPGMLLQIAGAYLILSVLNKK